MYRDLFMTEDEELKARIEAAKKTSASFPSIGMTFRILIGFPIRSLRKASMIVSMT